MGMLYGIINSGTDIAIWITERAYHDDNTFRWIALYYGHVRYYLHYNLHIREDHICWSIFSFRNKRKNRKESEHKIGYKYFITFFSPLHNRYGQRGSNLMTGRRVEGGGLGWGGTGVRESFNFKCNYTSQEDFCPSSDFSASVWNRCNRFVSKNCRIDDEEIIVLFLGP